MKNSIISCLNFLYLSSMVLSVDYREWAWLGGSKEAGEVSNFGTAGRRAPTNFPGCRSYTDMVFDEANMRFFFYGGTCGQGSLGDLWKYDIALGQWTFMRGFQSPTQVGSYTEQPTVANPNTPSSRYGAISLFEQQSQLMYVFGGIGPSELADDPTRESYLNDFWRYSTLEDSWAFISGSTDLEQLGIYGAKGVLSRDHTPGARAFGAQFFDSSSNRLYMFGGKGCNQEVCDVLLNDLWFFDRNARQWAFVSGGQTKPEYSVYDAEIGILSTANAPGGRMRMSHAFSKDQRAFYMFGGYGLSDTAEGILSDFWRYEPANEIWTLMSGDVPNVVNAPGLYKKPFSTNPLNQTTGGSINYKENALSKYPGSRQGAIAAFDSYDFVFYVRGGYGYAANSDEGELNDFWFFNTTSFEWFWIEGNSTVNVNPIYAKGNTTDRLNNPGARAGSLSVYSSDSQTFYLFGGESTYNGSQYKNDFWSNVIVQPYSNDPKTDDPDNYDEFVDVPVGINTTAVIIIAVSVGVLVILGVVAGVLVARYYRNKALEVKFVFDGGDHQFLEYITPEQFKIGKLVSKTRTSSLHLGQPSTPALDAAGKSILVKKLGESREKMKSAEKAGLDHELRMLWYFKEKGSKYFTQCLGYCSSPVCVLMKHYPTDLHDWLYKKDSADKGPETSLYFLSCIAEALNFMHEHGLAYCDLKPRNVWLERDDKKKYFPVLAEFTCTAVIPEGTFYMRQFQTVYLRGSSIAYQAPDAISRFRKPKEGYQSTLLKPADVYSFGILLYEVWFKKTPYPKPPGQASSKKDDEEKGMSDSEK